MDSADDLAVVMPEPGSFVVDGLDFGLDDLDFDLAADEFCDAYAAFVADPGNKPGAGAAVSGGWLAGSGVGGSSREGSPDSSLTDGPLAGEEAMSAYVSELEQFLMDDAGVDVDEVACPSGERAPEVTISADDYFGDLLTKGDAAAANGAAAAEVTINADDYFGDLLAKGDAAAANGAAAADKEPEEDADLAAREDGTASRKRARHKIKGTFTVPWRELEVTRRHLARAHEPTSRCPGYKQSGACSPMALFLILVLLDER